MLRLHVVVLRNCVHDLLSRVVVNVGSQRRKRIVAHLRVIRVGTKKFGSVWRRGTAARGGVWLSEGIAGVRVEAERWSLRWLLLLGGSFVIKE
jgi:hypothetical protein